MAKRTGETLAERVWRAENALLVTVNAFRGRPSKDEVERMERMERLRYLAELVLRARVQLLKKNVAAARGPIAEARARRATATKALHDAQDAGVDAILLELGVAREV